MTLILFCKRPRLGVGKQRLALVLGQQGAFRIADMLHRCALAQLASWPGTTVIACADAADCDSYRAEFPWVNTVIAQQGNNLGQRINHVERQLRAAGHEQLIIIGSDMPEQTPDQLLAAAEKLAQHDIVLSAATDGGVTLMAAAVAWPELDTLPWSTPELGQALVECCEQAGLSVGWVTPCDDVDLVEDLRRLRTSLAADPRAPQQAVRNLIQELL
jgi:rSAM/selenodomain-associated transferase 1